MDAYTPLINGALLAVFMIGLAWLGKGRFDRLEKEVAELRGMIMQLAIAVGVQKNPQTG